MDSIEKIKERLNILDIELQAFSGKYNGVSGWRFDAAKYLLFSIRRQQFVEVKKMSELLATKSIMVK